MTNTNKNNSNNNKKVEDDIMKNAKEIFSKENFDSEAFTELIYTAMGVFVDRSYRDSYIWVSLETLEAEKASFEITDFEGLENGFIVKISEKPEEDLWEGVVRCFVNYFNENFDRNFEYKEWYEPHIAENDEEVFTDDQLYSMFETFQNIYLENIDEEDSYYIMVDMQNYKAVKAVKEIVPADDKYEFILVQPMDIPGGLSYVFENCSDRLSEYFDTNFELIMGYEFEIYE